MFIPPHIYGCYSPNLRALPPLCLVNTFQSSHMNLLLVNKVHPTPSAKGSPTGDFTFSPLCGRCGHMTVLTHRTGQAGTHQTDTLLVCQKSQALDTLALPFLWAGARTSLQPTITHTHGTAPQGRASPVSVPGTSFEVWGRRWSPFSEHHFLMHRIITNYIEIQLLRY